MTEWRYEQGTDGDYSIFRPHLVDPVVEICIGEDFSEYDAKTIVAAVNQTKVLHEAIVDVLAMPVIQDQFHFLQRGIGTATKGGRALLRLKAMLDKLDEGKEAGLL